MVLRLSLAVMANRTALIQLPLLTMILQFMSWILAKVWKIVVRLVAIHRFGEGTTYHWERSDLSNARERVSINVVIEKFNFFIDLVNVLVFPVVVFLY